MLRVALKSLFHDKGRFAAATAGVAVSATLALVQIALYYGFLESSSLLISHAHADLWVMARGTRVLESAQPLSGGTRSVVQGPPCVDRVRGVVVGFAPIALESGREDTVQVLGVEPSPEAIVPWDIAHGLPSDLRGPLHVSIDELDLGKLDIRGPILGRQLSIRGERALVTVLTHGIRSFVLTPYIFAELVQARWLSGLMDGQVHYWILNAKQPECLDSIVAAIERHPDLQARRSSDFAASTQDYWVGGSGAGAVLSFGAVLGLLVGSVIVAQTLFSLTRDHLPELATLKALGASREDVMAFVLWQAGFLATTGSVIAVALTYLTAAFGAEAGLILVITPGVLAAGIGSVLIMCVVASITSLRKVLSLSAHEAFK